MSFQKGGPEHKTALVQIATSKGCYLLQTCATGMTGSLRALLEDPTVVKCGVRIRGDAAKLKRDFGLEMGGVQELQDMARARMRQLPKGGLAGLAARLLGRNLEKPKGLRLGNWERVPLNEAQQKYAALDAYACWLLFEKLHSMEERKDSPADAGPAAMRDAQVGQDALTPRKRRRSVRLSLGKENDDGPGTMPEVAPRTREHLQRPMQLSKQEKYFEHYRQRKTLDEIAAHFGLKRSTCQNYIIEALERGLPYHFELLGVPEGALARVRSVAEALPGVLDDAVIPLGSIKAIKETLDRAPGGGVEYGDVRLCVEHLRRRRTLAREPAAASAAP